MFKKMVAFCRIARRALQTSEKYNVLRLMENEVPGEANGFHGIIRVRLDK